MPRKRPDPDTPKRTYIGRCSSIAEVRAETARLYRAARLKAGPTPNADEAYKLSLILGLTAKLIETSELETRLAEVERRTAPPANDPNAVPLRRVS